ncbi:MAG: AsmA family protein [Alphaproteobacteria bacterium]|nr:AsmA family protein [Alphaproteobacteria bacterium]
MKKLKRTMLVFGLLLVVVGVGLFVFVKTIDIEKYKPQLISVMEKKTGRTVRLDGPMALSLGFGGLSLSVEKASISNPSWARRPLLASIGRLSLGLDVWPLLEKQLSVNNLTIEAADIQLETNAQGAKNWVFIPMVSVQAVEPTKETKDKKETQKTVAAPSRASLRVQNVRIVDSTLTAVGSDGQKKDIHIASLLLKEDKGVNVSMKGDSNGVPLTVSFRTSLDDFLSQEPFSFEGTVEYGGLHGSAKGAVYMDVARANVSVYEVFVKESKLTGAFEAGWGGQHPVVKGTIHGEAIDPKDFKGAFPSTRVSAKKGAPATSASSQAPVSDSAPARLFSNAPLPLDLLKKVDASMQVTLKTFVVGRGALKDVKASLAVSGGRLILSPVRAYVGDVPVDALLEIDASKIPAKIEVGMKADGIDLGSLQKLGDMSAFLSGKAGAHIRLAGHGKTPHEIASSLNGVVTVTAEKGEIFSGIAAGVSSLLATLFNASGEDSALNCLAARFIVKNGIMKDNGILIDSAASTVFGKGFVDLRKESVVMTLHARTKLLDIGGVIPALLIEGPLNDVAYSVNASGLVKDMINTLLEGNPDIISSNVPVMQKAPAGGNACVYTLDHPQKEPEQGILPIDTLDRASKKIQNIGDSLVKGLFGQ